MKKLFVLLLLLALPAPSAQAPQAPQAPRPLVFTHVTVLDMTGAPARPDITYCFPGFSLHDELALLVEAGLSPLEALQAATLNPARFLGREKDLGTVENGRDRRSLVMG